MILTTDNHYNWPNILTLVRIALIPLLVIFYYLPVDWSHTAAAFVFACASATDWLDGYLARYLRQTTKLGAFLDPVADKLMVSIVLVLVVAEPAFQYVSLPSSILRVPTFFVTIPAAVIVAREIVVSALREWMAEYKQRARVAVSQLGKVKTAVQMFSLIIMLYCRNATSAWLVFLGMILLYAAAVLTIWSMCLYLQAAFTQMRLEE